MGLFSNLFKRHDPSRKMLLELQRKVASLEHQLQEGVLIDKKTLKEILENKQHSPPKETPAGIHVEHLQVDKIIIEKFDYSNNFGQLGIKELTGKLNIGTNYEGDFTDAISKKLKEKLGNQAKVNFRAKNES